MIQYMEVNYNIYQDYLPMSDQQQCQNCLQYYPPQKLATHFGYCRRNIKKCPQCNNMYDINNKEEHDEEYHKKSICKYCKLQFKPIDFINHQNICTKRTKYCQYCQLNVPVLEFQKHVKACQARTRNCEGCGMLVRVGDYIAHTLVCKEEKEKEKNKKIMAAAKKQPKNGKNNYIYDVDKDELTDFIQKKQMDFKKKETQKYNVPARNRPTDSIPSSNNTRGSSRTGLRTKPQTQLQNFNKQITGKGSSNSHQAAKPAVRTSLQKIETKLQKKDAQQSYGVKRPIVSGVNGIKKQQVSNSIKSQSYKHSNTATTKVDQKKSESHGINRNIDYRDFNDYYQYDQYNDNIPSDIFSPKNPYMRPPSQQLQKFDQDEQIQKAILQSMQQQNKSTKNNRKQNFENLPKDLRSEQLMRASWTKDFDIQKQMAIYQEIQRNAKKGKK